MNLSLKTAYKNIIGAGKRTWLNVAVLSFTFVLIVFYNALGDGWVEDARRSTIEWSTGYGEIWHPKYDRYDAFSLQDAHGIIPGELQADINDGNVTPILVTQGVIYPQGRMQNVLLNGIDPNQKIIKIPSQKLHSPDSTFVAVIGERMAKAASLQINDRVMMRWRNKNGTFDASEIKIVDIFNTTVPAVDNMQIWLNLNDLQRMMLMPGEATYCIQSEAKPIQGNIDGWVYKDLKSLTEDIDAMQKAQRFESFIIFGILLAIALLAIFDTQVLSIFRRQKEIGTYVALGMTPRHVSALFTLEGSLYSVLGIVAGAIWGLPFFILFAHYGLDLSGKMTETGAVGSNILYPAYNTGSIIFCILTIVIFSALVSYLPSRKIAKQNIVNALKGKIP